MRKAVVKVEPFRKAVVSTGGAQGLCGQVRSSWKCPSEVPLQGSRSAYQPLQLVASLGTSLSGDAVCPDRGAIVGIRPLYNKSVK